MSNLIPKLFCYFRYIDDILGIINSNDLTLLTNAFKDIQTIVPNISFTMVHSNTHIEFLDLILFKHPHPTIPNKSILKVRCHQKPINTYAYITDRSFHPSALKKGFIFSELLRYARNCSLYEDFVLLRRRFKLRLLARGYSLQFLRSIFTKVDYNNRATFLQAKTPHNSNILPFATRHHPILDSLQIGKTLKEFESTFKLIGTTPTHHK